MQFEDIHLSDTQLYALFRQYYTAGNYTAALNLLATNPQLDLKVITADNLNELSERVYGLENVYYTEVTDYLNNLLSNMQISVNNLSNQNQYSATTQYYPNNFVYYNDEVYFCIQEPPIGTLPTDTTYWLYLGLFGESGRNSVTNLDFKGQWNANIAYNSNDVVYVERQFYWALQDNTEQSPTVQPNSYWSLFPVIAEAQQIVVSDTDPIDNLVTADFWWQTN